MISPSSNSTIKQPVLTRQPPPEGWTSMTPQEDVALLLVVFVTTQHHVKGLTHLFIKLARTRHVCRNITRTKLALN